jgi:hypothetical protein
MGIRLVLRGMDGEICGEVLIFLEEFLFFFGGFCHCRLQQLSGEGPTIAPPLSKERSIQKDAPFILTLLV